MKILRMLAWLFGGIGLALVIGAFFAWQHSSSFASRATKTSGEVVDLAWVVDSDGGSVAHPVIAFTTADGRTIEFQSSMGSNPPAYAAGERVGVLYDPANPQDASIDSFWSQYLLATILGGIGVVFLAVGVGMLLARIRSRRKNEMLAQNGRRVTTSVTSVDLNESVSVNGRSPYVITSQWLNPDTGTLHVFRSENLWYDPSEFLDGETIDVLIDPSNPRKYAMDLSRLPKMA